MSLQEFRYGPDEICEPPPIPPLSTARRIWQALANAAALTGGLGQDAPHFPKRENSKDTGFLQFQASAAMAASPSPWFRVFSAWLSVTPYAATFSA